MLSQIKLIYPCNTLYESAKAYYVILNKGLLLGVGISIMQEMRGNKYQARLTPEPELLKNRIQDISG
jgi:hypothetical protein